MNIKTSMLAVLAAGSMVSLAAANTQNGGVYVGAGFGMARSSTSSWYRSPYQQGLFQVAQPQMKSNIPLYHFTLGYHLENFPLRFELAFNKFGRIDEAWSSTWTALTNESAKGSIDNTNLMFNIYYDLVNSTDFVPYVGAGIGYSQNKTAYNYFSSADGREIDAGTGHTSNHSLALGIAAGVNYNLGEHWQIGLGINYMSLGKVTLNEVNHCNIGLVCGETGVSRADHLYVADAMAKISYLF